MHLRMHCCGFENKTDRPSDADCPNTPIDHNGDARCRISVNVRRFCVCSVS
jgi:hypothetical protein